MINKKNLPLLLAMSIPVVMIVVLALSIYLPGMGKQPKQDFVYATGNIDYSGYQYPVVNGQVQQIEPRPLKMDFPDQKFASSVPANFYRYDVKNNTSISLQFDAVQKLRLSPSIESSDGYTVERGNGEGNFPFGGGGDYNSWFLKGHNRASKLKVKLDSSPYNYTNLQFIGWVE